MKVTVYTTNNYPRYEKQVISVRGMKAAQEKADEIEKEIAQKLRHGELQDAMIVVSYK